MENACRITFLFFLHFDLYHGTKTTVFNMPWIFGFALLWLHFSYIEEMLQRQISIHGIKNYIYSSFVLISMYRFNDNVQSLKFNTVL